MGVAVFHFILAALGAYLLGSIPFGFLAAKAKGIDIRTVGSGNIGATNAMRVLGKPMGIGVLLLDALKGYVAVKGAGALALALGGNFTFPAEHIRGLELTAGIFAVLGHNYTCWLRFKGGKGVATSAGVYLALAPLPLAIALGVFVLTVAVTRYVSAGSMAAALALAAAVWILQPGDIPLGVVTTALGAMVIYKHKSNLQRLRAGTENRFGRKAAPEK